MATEKASFWQTKYRFILLRDENLEKIFSKQFKGLYIALIVGLFVLLINLLLVSIIIFTPVKKWIPGYNGWQAESDYVELAKQVDEVKKKSRAQSLMITKLQKLLRGEHVDVNAVADKGNVLQREENVELVERIPEDEALRNKLREGGTQRMGMNIEEAELEDLFERTLFAPVKGVISAGFHRESGHYGTDILAEKDAAISSIDEGVVITSDYTLETGYTIGVQHADGLVSIYKHNASVSKDVGDAVEAGEAIAIIGNTGHLTSGPHLHFELWYNGTPLNPTNFINFEKNPD